ncbi:MAG TPA: hypothetical protein VGX96_06990 [Candidatus Elarobacter sp.]|nr:hypothetical protein [Candidatus Elarobacter sp.]
MHDLVARADRYTALIAEPAISLLQGVCVDMKRLASIFSIASPAAAAATAHPVGASLALAAGAGGGAGCFLGSAATTLGILTADPVLGILGFWAATSFC